MCGIAGYIDWRKKEGSYIKGMIDSLKHRGPDGQGSEVYESPFAKIHLGQRRLSVIDLSQGGHQPMSFGSYHIVFNGEIYNYKALRKELIDLGHSFESHSDTEVILHAFAQWREKAVDRFIGMFTFVIYDSKAQKVYLFRDRAGIKPLYYFYKEGLFLFGSELKALTAHGHFPKEMDMNAAALFFKYGYILAPHSIYKHTFKVMPGSFMELDLCSQTIEQKKYWNVLNYYGKEKLQISFDQAKEELHSLLIDAFKLRLVADVPVGVFLSGGYDSAVVTALLSRHSDQKIKTFTIGFEDDELNEANEAGAIARHFNTDHTEYYCREKEALEIIPDLSYYYDEPFFDISSIPSILLSRVARKSVTVALSADAGDEIFAGYHNHGKVLSYAHALGRIPLITRPFIKHGLSLAAQLSPKRQLLWKHRLLGGYALMKNKENRGSVLLDLMSQKNREQAIGRLFHPSLKIPQTQFDLHKDSSFPDLSLLDQALATDYLTYLPDNILCKVDRASMSASLEGREPFLDHRIIEYVARLPDDFKYRGGIQKYILKEICHEYIPENKMNRPKKGFVLPLERYLRGELKNYLLDRVNKKSIKNQPFLNEKYCLYARDQFLKGNDQFFNIAWGLTVFLSWGERWLK